MVWESQQRSAREVWRLARRQHGLITRAQLRALGYSDRAIEHRIAHGRLHRLYRGVFAVGRPEVTDRGRWLAAVLACGGEALLSHLSAARLWKIVLKDDKLIHVSVTGTDRVRPGIAVHRRHNLGRRDVASRDRIPVTAPTTTIVDIACGASEPVLERAINEADQRGVIRFDALQRELERMPRRPGAGRVKQLVLRHTFHLSRSDLERLFRPIAERVGLGRMETLAIVNGFEVDFWFPDLGLVVEAKSLTYHRTPIKQTTDVVRDQRHFANDVWPLHFTHWQIARQPAYVEGILRAVTSRLAKRPRAGRERGSPARL